MNEKLIEKIFERLVKEHILTPLDAMTLEEYFIKYAKEEMKKPLSEPITITHWQEGETCIEY